MKGNIMKLAVIVMTAAIAMFTAVSMAPADDNKWKAIGGEYAMTASGACLFSSGGFNPNDTPIGTSWGGSSMATGIWTFKRDGTGTVKGTQFGLTLPPANPGYSNPSAASAGFSFDFTYKVTDDGMITVEKVGLYKATYLTGPLKDWTFTISSSGDFFGNVSADHKTITLASANEVEKITLTNGTVAFDVYSICNIGRVLIRLGE